MCCLLQVLGLLCTETEAQGVKCPVLGCTAKKAKPGIKPRAAGPTKEPHESSNFYPGLKQTGQGAAAAVWAGHVGLETLLVLFPRAGLVSTVRPWCPGGPAHASALAYRHPRPSGPGLDTLTDWHPPLLTKAPMITRLSTVTWDQEAGEGNQSCLLGQRQGLELEWTEHTDLGSSPASGSDFLRVLGQAGLPS